MNYICNRFNKISCHTKQIINSLHTTIPSPAWTKSELPRNFLRYNKKIYPPGEINEEPRKAVSN